MTPFISVIVPVYKVPLDFLRVCLDSLQAQTMQESEFIIVSDGAPEAECSVCEEYATKDTRFKFFKREHAGVSATRNYGINQAQGEYITFVDSDDKISPNFCSSIYNKAYKCNSDILLFEQALEKRKTIFNFSLYNHDISQISSNQYKDLLTRLYLPKACNGLILSGVCCKAYRQSFINNNFLRFEPNLHYSEDQFFCLKAFLRTQKITYLSNSPLYTQVHRISSSSFAYKSNYEKEVYYYLEKIRHIAEINSNLIDLKLFYDRAIQCILYTLDKCIFRPDHNITFKARKSLFKNFVSNKYCKEALLKYDKSNFSLPERIACSLCNKEAFWTLFLVSKKWHIQYILGK